jgi:hypothetical protein
MTLNIPSLQHNENQRCRWVNDQNRPGSAEEMLSRGFGLSCVRDCTGRGALLGTVGTTDELEDGAREISSINSISVTHISVK